MLRFRRGLSKQANFCVELMKSPARYSRSSRRGMVLMTFVWRRMVFRESTLADENARSHGRWRLFPALLSKPTNYYRRMARPCLATKGRSCCMPAVHERKSTEAVVATKKRKDGHPLTFPKQQALPEGWARPPGDKLGFPHMGVVHPGARRGCRH